jgi:hypothetical protein
MIITVALPTTAFAIGDILSCRDASRPGRITIELVTDILYGEQKGQLPFSRYALTSGSLVNCLLVGARGGRLEK